MQYKDPITGKIVDESDIKCECCGKQISPCGISRRLARKQSLIDHIRCYDHRQSNWTTIEICGKVYKGNLYDVGKELSKVLSCSVCGMHFSTASIVHRIQREYDFSKPMKCDSCNWNSNEHRLFRIYRLSLSQHPMSCRGYLYFADFPDDADEDHSIFKFGITSDMDHRNGMFGSKLMNYRSVIEGSWEFLCRLEYEIKKKFTSEYTFNKYGSNEWLPQSFKKDIKQFIKHYDCTKLSPLPKVIPRD